MEITLKRPDDWHLHLRDGEMLKRVAPLSGDFARAIIMPNLVPPVVTTQMAKDYRERIVAAGFSGPLMTLYLTEDMSPDEIDAAKASGIVYAAKLYPAGATTNSASGVRDVTKIYPVLERMEALALPLCVHGEVTDAEVDIFDREAVFIERVLSPIREKFPGLKIIMEHVTTKDGVDFVRSASENLAATLTVHHLILDRNDLLVGGVKPHFYCLPILKRNTHKHALREAAMSGDPRFFLGTDSAPHSKDKKECDCCAAGVFSAPNAMAWLAQIFEEDGKLDQLEKFTSIHGPKYYGLPLNEDKITLIKEDEPVKMPKSYGNDAHEVVLFDPAQPLYWKVKN